MAKPKKKRRPRPLSPKQIDKIEEEYGLAYALFKAFPELNNLLQSAVKDHWTPAKFQVELRQTNWFKKHSDVWRKNIALKYTDPASYNERLQNNITAVRNLSASVGVTFIPKNLRYVAERALLFGWDEGQLRDYLAQYVRPNAQGDFGGALAAAENNLSQLAHQNGVRVNRNLMTTWMRNIARGEGTEDQFQNYIRNQAAGTFKLYADQIRAGANVYDIANPYINAMAQTLELNPNQVDLFDPTVRRALSGVRNDKGQLEEMSVTDFEDQLRQDKRWQYTQQANEQAKGYVNAISKMWGLR